MKSLCDKTYVKDQYESANKLNDRIYLHHHYSTNKQGWMNWVFEQLSSLEGEQLLEIGGGTGALWETAGSNLPPSWQITFSDQSEAMVKKSCTHLNADSFVCLQLDGQKLPFPDVSFDGVIANHMFYHLPDLPAALQEICRVLRPKGYLFATTVGKTHTSKLKSMISRFVPSYEAKESAPSFNLENGASKLSPYFAEVERRDYEDSLFITESEPLVRYAKSLVTELPEATFREYVSSLMSQDGHIKIGKSSGLFIARKCYPS